MNIDKKEYLDMIQSEEYANLYQYYMQDTYLDILGVARQENPHSSFIRWLLDPTGSHGLGDFPLRKMIETLLLAKEKLNGGRFTNIENQADKNKKLINLCSPAVEQSFLEALLFGNYVLSDVKVFRELCLAGQRRADIFVSFKAVSGDVSYPCILLIENKIKSAEHDQQTKEYFDDINVAVKSTDNDHNSLRNVLKDQCGFPLDEGQSHKIYAFFVYLTAERSSVIKGEIQNNKNNLCPASNEFLWINYQYLLDGVLEPCMKYSTTELTKQRISEYIRCLGQDSKLGDITLTAEAAKSANDMYLIMAVSSREKKWALELYNDCKKKMMIEQIFTSLAKEPNPFGAKEEKFWSCVANLYLIILTEEKDGQFIKLAHDVVNVKSSSKKEFYFNNKTYRMKARKNSLGRLCHDLIQWVIDNSESDPWDEKQVKDLREVLWKKGMTNWLLDIFLFEDEKVKLNSCEASIIVADDPQQLRKYHIDNREDLKTHFFSEKGDAIKISSTFFYVAKYWTYSDYQILKNELDKMGYKNISVEEINLE